MNAQATLKELAQGFATSAIGDEFFQSLAIYLAKTLEVDYVFIGELAQNDQLIHTVSFLDHGKQVEPIEYAVIGSLCEYVVKPDFCAFTSGVQELFPENQASKVLMSIVT